MGSLAAHQEVSVEALAGHHTEEVKDWVVDGPRKNSIARQMEDQVRAMSPEELFAFGLGSKQEAGKTLMRRYSSLTLPVPDLGSSSPPLKLSPTGNMRRSFSEASLATAAKPQLPLKLSSTSSGNMRLRSSLSEASLTTANSLKSAPTLLPRTFTSRRVHATERVPSRTGQRRSALPVLSQTLIA